MRYFMSLALIAGIAAIGCSRTDDAPKEIVVHIKMSGEAGSKEAAQRSMIHATKTVVTVFKTPLDMYELDVGHFPATSDGLTAIKNKPDAEDADKWQGPYLEKDPLPDAWGSRASLSLPRRA